MISKTLYGIGGILIKAYSKIMLKMNVFSHSPIPQGAKIIVANHPTTTDPFILTSVSNGQAAVLIKDVLFDVPVFGRYLHMAGHIPVREGRGTVAFERALEKLKQGITVIVFIEGDLSKYLHRVGKAKTGAIRLAILSGRPIVPVGISVKSKYVRSIRSFISGIEEWGKWYFKGPYAITVGKQINIKGLVTNRNHVENLSNWLKNIIAILQRESAKRIK